VATVVAAPLALIGWAWRGRQGKGMDEGIEKEDTDVEK